VDDSLSRGSFVAFSLASHSRLSLRERFRFPGAKALNEPPRASTPPDNQLQLHFEPSPKSNVQFEHNLLEYLALPEKLASFRKKRPGPANRGAECLLRMTRWLRLVDFRSCIIAVIIVEEIIGGFVWLISDGASSPVIIRAEIVGGFVWLISRCYVAALIIGAEIVGRFIWLISDAASSPSNSVQRSSVASFG
jgi:hypothetical protein